MAEGTENPKPFEVVRTELPGPDRQRSPVVYNYRLLYRSADSAAQGCVMSWEVTGGRMPYQIALERDEADNLRLHCTCADAVFRAEELGRFCKHIQGLLHFGRGESVQSASA
jgi:hypothetical protein